MKIAALAFVGLLVSAQPASAAVVYELKASGKVSSISGLGNYTSTGAIKIGDPFSYTIYISPPVSHSTPHDGYEIYYQGVKSTYTFGTYSATGNNNYNSVEISNNETPYPGGKPFDAISFDLSSGYINGSPFNFSSNSPVYSSVSFSGQDSVTANTLDGYDFDQLNKLTNFPTKFAQINFDDFSTNSIVVVSGYATSISLIKFAPSVPETETWTMMILGFGAVGCAMRRRPQKEAFA